VGGVGSWKIFAGSFWKKGAGGYMARPWLRAKGVIGGPIRCSGASDLGLEAHAVTYFLCLFLPYILGLVKIKLDKV
jgi:hypothetical protein